MSSYCKSYSHFFSKKFQHICVSLDGNFNESLTNDIVSFEQLGPDISSNGYLEVRLWLDYVDTQANLSLFTKTRLYNFDPLKPHCYIVKLEFTGVNIIFLIFAQKHRLWVPVRTASARRF